MLGLGSIFYVALLVINAMAILSEERFLARIGWTSSQSQAGYHQTYDPYANMNMQQREDIGMKAKLINLIGAVRTLMRVPLIFINIVVIGYEIILGG